MAIIGTQGAAARERRAVAPEDQDGSARHAIVFIGRSVVGIMLSAIALFSSPRRLGNTGQLIDRIALELDIEVVDLAQPRYVSVRLRSPKQE